MRRIGSEDRTSQPLAFTQSGKRLHALRLVMSHRQTDVIDVKPPDGSV
jgi:hypothetical protein